MSKDKNQYIQIPIPKWRWWQTGLIIVAIIGALKLEPLHLISIFKEVLIKWLLN